MKLGDVILMENVLPEGTAVHIRDTLLSDRFPWYWNERTLEEGESSDYTKATHQFTHVFCVNGKENSNYNYIPQEITKVFTDRYGLEVQCFIRTKANLLCTLGDVDIDQQHEIHTDIVSGENVYSIVYYVGESDGDTVMYDGDKESCRIPHKHNSAAMFNSMNTHRGSLPRQHKRRVVINIVFQAKEKNGGR
jgi:hypothetical protein